MTPISILALVSVLNPAVGRYCNSPPPGINKMRRGVDVTTLDLLPLDLMNTGQDGFRKPIIDFTCNLNRTWKDRRNNIYELPDKIWDILNVPGGLSHADVKILKSSKQVKESMAYALGLDVGFVLGMFSASHSYQRMQYTLSHKSSYIEEVSAYLAGVKVDFVPPFAMNGSEHFKRKLSKLSEDFTTKPSQYFHFIKKFGTHYFTSGNFGGLIKMNIDTKASYYNRKSNKKVETQVKASLLGLFNAGWSKSSSKSKVDKNFAESSSQSLRYFGGDVNLLTKEHAKGLASWQKTVITNPWLFSGELVPITDFVQDIKKRNSLKRATTAYLNKAYLRELMRTVQASRTFHGAKSVLTRIEAELEKAEPNQSEVDLLSEEVDLDFQVPSWFRNDLQFCYNWTADGDRHQCWSAGGNTLCANPGHMTLFYRDHTDRRSGGCKMSWGLIPKRKTQPLWFRDVKICYRWYGDRDYSQCSKSRRGLYCAPLNKYTDIYTKELMTDREVVGCPGS